MKLTVLCDNNTFIDNYLLAEPALCFYLDNGKDKILFDMGYSNVYKINAKKLGIDLSKITKIVFSHGHDDHTKGLTKFNFDSNPKIYYCRGCFDRKKSDTCEIGSPYRLDKMREKFSLSEVVKPAKISNNLYFLGSVPRVFEFENSKDELYVFNNNKWERDTLMDDSALVYDGKDGLSIITGCSHSGICNIINYAKKLFNKNVKLIIGGFHLFENNNKAKQTIKYLLDQGVNNIYPCHCTTLSVKSKMIEGGLNVHEVGSGLQLDIN